MNASFHEAWALLPDYLGQHVILSVSALLLGVAISLPLGIVAARSSRLGTPLLAVVSVVQTIPGLALLALFYPLLLALSVVTQDLFGFSIPRAGLSARAAGADALCDAADAAQSGDGAGGHRSRHPDGGQGRGHDAAPVAVTKSNCRWPRR